MDKAPPPVSIAIKKQMDNACNDFSKYMDKFMIARHQVTSIRNKLANGTTLVLKPPVYQVGEFELQSDEVATSKKALDDFFVAQKSEYTRLCYTLRKNTLLVLAKHLNGALERAVQEVSRWATENPAYSESDVATYCTTARHHLEPRFKSIWAKAEAAALKKTKNRVALEAKKEAAKQAAIVDPTPNIQRLITAETEKRFSQFKRSFRAPSQKSSGTKGGRGRPNAKNTKHAKGLAQKQQHPQQQQHKRKANSNSDTSKMAKKLKTKTNSKSKRTDRKSDSKPKSTRSKMTQRHRKMTITTKNTQLQPKRSGL